MSLITDQPEGFRQFDVVTDDSDHSYLNHWNNKSTKNNNNNNGVSDWYGNPSSGVHKKIMKEWRVLERNLPEGVYVRVYERRLDLLRAAIVGPAGTPYHDGVFVFDVAFPPDYPARPPLVHYRSFGMRINPNLYANGKVCLSLLNTWFGSRNEKWNPGESTVLQILVSIQGLVLNKNPFFNEPGAALSITGRQNKKSMAYTENAFILSCITMVYLLKKPPKNFEPFISTHFRDRSTHILSACNAYMNSRAAVGCYETGSDKGFKVSKKFQALMKSWYPHLVVVFKGTGASLGSLEQLMVSNGNDSDVKKKEKQQQKKKSSGFWKLIGIVKRVLGCKKVSAEKRVKVNSSSS